MKPLLKLPFGLGIYRRDEKANHMCKLPRRVKAISKKTIAYRGIEGEVIVNMLEKEPLIFISGKTNAGMCCAHGYSLYEAVKEWVGVVDDLITVCNEQILRGE